MREFIMRMVDRKNKKMSFGLLFLFLFINTYTSAQTSDSTIVNELRKNGVSFSNNNSVTLLMSGKEKFEDMFKAIRQAKSSIHLEYFNFRNDTHLEMLRIISR